MKYLPTECLYGMPGADQILFNRYYTLGYDYYTRQAKWGLEIVDPDKEHVSRSDNFRTDQRIPKLFRADLIDYKGSGFDRGHIIASANKREIEIQNSETFLLSNMSPQTGKMNSGIMKTLEGRVRDLCANDSYLEVRVCTGPIFYYGKKFKVIGNDDKNGVSIPVPHAFFKSVLAETTTGKLHLWSFEMLNNKYNFGKDISKYQVSTRQIEKLTGIILWGGVVGSKFERVKTKKRKIWAETKKAKEAKKNKKT